MHREYDLISLDALKKVRKKREKKCYNFLGISFKLILSGFLRETVST